MALEEATVGSRVEDLTRQERVGSYSCCCQGYSCIEDHEEDLSAGTNCHNGSRILHKGKWVELLRSSQCCDEQASVARRRVRRRVGDDVERRALRALSFTQIGELSSARQALEGAAIAPGTDTTRVMLTNPSKRPQEPYGVLPSFAPRSRGCFPVG